MSPLLFLHRTPFQDYAKCSFSSKRLEQQLTLCRLFSSSMSALNAVSNQHVSKIDPITPQQINLIQRGHWAEKESMDVYLRRALAVCRPFVDSVQLTQEEEKQFRIIKAWYQNDYIPQESTFLPFIKLEAIGKTFETAGKNYLKEKEIAFYLDQGLIGPLPIHSLTRDQLKTLSERFAHFNQEYYSRNLRSSLYSALRNKCLFQLVTNQEILSKVSSILGPNVALSNVSVHEIAPGSGKASKETNGMVNAFNCHSDLSSGSHYYFRPGANQVENLVLDNRGICVWVSISGTDAHNSPLYVFPKTHHWEIPTPFTHIENAKNDPVALDHVLKLLAFTTRNPARRLGLCNIEYDYLLSSHYQALLPALHRTEIYTKPGDVILFNQHTRHGSGFNASSQPRLAISLRFNTSMKEVGGIESAGAVVTQAEREALGFGNDPRKPMVQLLGEHHHPNNVPIDLERLEKEGF